MNNKRAAKGILTPDDYHGAAASYWFVTAWVIILFALIMAFYKTEPRWRTSDEQKVADEEQGPNEAVELRSTNDGDLVEVEKESHPPGFIPLLSEAGLEAVAAVQVRRSDA